MSPYGNFNLARQEWRKLLLKHSKITKRDGKPLQRKYKINEEVIWCTDISSILFYASEVWGIDCNGQLEKDPAELVQNKFLKWLLWVNNTAITMRAGLRQEGFQWELKPNVRTLSSG